MNGVLKRQWKTYYKKRTDVDNMQEDCVTLQMKPLVDCRGTRQSTRDRNKQAK